MSLKPLKLITFKQPLIIAHRGYRAQYPENTIASFCASLYAGAHMIELDVMLSRDREIVVIHDGMLERTTNGHGAVKNHKLEELKCLDAGSWFDPRFSQERIPLLREVLDRVANRVYINIELKASAYEPHKRHNTIGRLVVELVKKMNICDSVIISSFEWRMLEDISTMDNAPAVGLISRYPADTINRDLCAKLKVFSWHPNFNGLGGEQVEMMHEMGIKVFPYNVESLEQYAVAVKMKVDGVITSDPVLMSRSAIEGED